MKGDTDTENERAALDAVRSTDWLDRFERVSNSFLRAQWLLCAFVAGMVFAVLIMVACYIYIGGK